MLQVLRLGLPLGAGSTGALAEAARFLTVVGFAWPTRGGRQCWKTRGFHLVGYERPSPSRELWAKVCEVEDGTKLN